MSDAATTLPTAAPVPEPVNLPEPPSAHRARTEGRGRTSELRNEVAVALGIVVGLASLVKGYDSADPFRTVVLALTIGVVGLAVIYGTTNRR